MRVQSVSDPTSTDVAPDGPQRRRRWPIWLGVGLVVVTLGLVATVSRDRLEFPYEGPVGTVAPGEQVTIRDPDGVCGPLIVSLWEPGALGQWNRTHAGSAVGDSFSPAPHPWWKLWETESYDSGVPCPTDGEMTFSLPADVEPGTIAVCDSSRRCAELQVA